MGQRQGTIRVALLVLFLQVHGPLNAQERWKKHVVMQNGHCNTAVAIKLTGDQGVSDVIASYGGKVSLFRAPTFSEEVILHRFQGAAEACIHSAVIDVDHDGDLDWAGALAHKHPFWLENPGVELAYSGTWKARPIDPDITGIHCLLNADVNNDGVDDLIINNFEPEQGIADSIAWLETPGSARKDDYWQRHVFASGTARGGSHYMGIGDVDGDGWKEIAVGAKGSPFADGNWFAFWKHPGGSKSSGAWEKQILAIDQLGATNIQAADVNGDGKVDWIATRGHGSGVLWMENPSWKMREIDPEILNPHCLAVADFNGDGTVDAATCGYGSRMVKWYSNDGSGRFRAHLIDADQESYDLRAVDMDGDGDADLLNAGRASMNVVWYENPR